MVLATPIKKVTEVSLYSVAAEITRYLEMVIGLSDQLTLIT